MYTTSPIVIDNGSDTTKAGFAADDIPSLVFSTNYSAGENVVVGDLEAHPENEVMTLMDNGLIYDFDNVVNNWNYVYANLDAGYALDPKEYPLMMTEQVWNTKKNKLKTCQIVFEQMEVPIFSLVKKPLCQLYHMGRSNGLVIGLGSATASVTPVLDGIIQTKSSFHSKYAGDFVDANIIEHLKKQQPEFAESIAGSESYRNYHLAKHVLKDIKPSMLNVSDVPAQQYQYQITRKSFQLPNKTFVDFDREQIGLVETLFQPNLNVLGLPLPPPSFETPSTNGLSIMILATLKHLEGTILSSSDQQQINYNKFNEILRDLLSNILITGGSSLIPGLQQRIINDLYKLTNQYFPNYIFTQPNRLMLSTLNNFQTTDINETWDKKFNTWLGASNLSMMLNDTGDSNIATDNWFITKADYEELGEDLVLDKFK